MSSSDPKKTLFDSVVELAGLSAVIGPGIVRRALEEAGVDAEQGKPEDYLKALEYLRSRMTIYLSEDEVEQRCKAIREALEGGASSAQAAATEATEGPAASGGTPGSEPDPEDPSSNIRRSIELLQRARHRLGGTGDEKGSATKKQGAASGQGGNTSD